VACQVHGRGHAAGQIHRLIAFLLVMGKVLQIADDFLDPVDAFAGFAHQVGMIVKNHFQRIHIQAQ
jgi:hypothetical protein